MTQSSKSYQDKPTSKAWIVLFIGLIISTIFAVYLENKARIDGSELFHLRNERITSKIKQQFNIQSLFIQNTVARINSSEKLLDKTTFSEFIKDTQYQFFSLGVFSIHTLLRMNSVILRLKYANKTTQTIQFSPVVSVTLTLL